MQQYPPAPVHPQHYPPAQHYPQETQPPEKVKGNVLPGIVVAILVFALISATTTIGQSVSSVSFNSPWLPADSHRTHFASSAPMGFAFSEWSRPDFISLDRSNMMGLALWYRVTSLHVLDTQYGRLRTIYTGSDGTATSLTDSLWTLDFDGARTAIEVDVHEVDEDFQVDLLILEPGRLDLPKNLTAGQQWDSSGSATIWNSASQEATDESYSAAYSTAEAADANLAGRGCLDVTMEQTIGEQSSTTVRTWCPKVGIAAYSSPTGTWKPTDLFPVIDLGADEPFNWSEVESLTFNPLAIKELDFFGRVLVTPVSPMGVLNGAISYGDRQFPDLYRITLGDDSHMNWGVRPGGTLTATATFAGMTLVATTNRNVIAYDEDGRWLWETSLSDLTMVPPVRFQDWAIIVTLDGSVMALDLRTGATTWSTSLGEGIRSFPVATPDYLLVANQAGALACLDSKGAILWVVDAGVPQAMTVSGGEDPVVVYAAGGSVVLRGYSLSDGSLLWRSRVYQAPHDLYSLDSALVLRNESIVLGIDWATGDVLWNWSEQRTGAGFAGSERVLLLGDTDMILLDANGKQVRTWPHSFQGSITPSWSLITVGTTVIAFDGFTIEIGVM